MSKENRQFFEFGPYRIDTVNRQLMRDGEVVPLKAKAVDTLLLLIENRGDVLEKDDLMKSLWPDSFVEEANLRKTFTRCAKRWGMLTTSRLFRVAGTVLWPRSKSRPIVFLI